MKHTLLNKLSSVVAVMVLCTTATALPAVARDKRETPAYTDKIPGKITTPNKVKTRSGPSLRECSAAERQLRRSTRPHTSDQALWTLIRNRSRSLCFSG